MQNTNNIDNLTQQMVEEITPDTMEKVDEVPPRPLESVVKKRKNYHLGNGTRRGSVDINTLLNYAKKGYRYTDIAKLVKTTVTNVSQRLKPYEGEIDAVIDYEQTRGFRLANAERKLLGRVGELTGDEKVTLSQASVAFGILFDKGRLERGQSTANVASICQIAEKLDTGAHLDDDDRGGDGGE